VIAGTVKAVVSPRAARDAFIRAALWMSVSGAVWAAMEELGRRVPRAYSPYQLVLVRYAAHLALMLLVFAPRLGRGLVQTRRPVVQWVRSLLMLGMPACFIAAIRWMPSDDVWALFWAAPLGAAAAARLFIGERIPPRRWLALAVGLAGAGVAMRPSVAALRSAAVLAIGMSACFAAYVVMTSILRTERTATNLFYTALGVFLALGVAAPVFWRPLTLSALAPMVAVGWVGFVGLYALDRSLAQVEISAIAPLLYLEVVFALPVLVMSGQSIGRSALAGAGVIAVMSVWYVSSAVRQLGSVS
jgi:drug/metabolite transporter (DMT)-like permease